MEEAFKALVMYINTKGTLTFVAEIVTVFMFILVFFKNIFNDNNHRLYFLTISLFFTFSAIVSFIYVKGDLDYQIKIIFYYFIFISLYVAFIPMTAIFYKSGGKLFFALSAFFIILVVANCIAFILLFIHESVANVAGSKSISVLLDIFVCSVFLVSVIKSFCYQLKKKAVLPVPIKVR